MHIRFCHFPLSRRAQPFLSRVDMQMFRWEAVFTTSHHLSNFRPVAKICMEYYLKTPQSHLSCPITTATGGSYCLPGKVCLRWPGRVDGYQGWMTRFTQAEKYERWFSIWYEILPVLNTIVSTIQMWYVWLELSTCTRGRWCIKESFRM